MNPFFHIFADRSSSIIIQCVAAQHAILTPSLNIPQKNKNIISVEQLGRSCSQSNRYRRIFRVRSSLKRSEFRSDL
jgi:hypothetical protein